jgi:hypothetical protein
MAVPRLVVLMSGRPADRAMLSDLWAMLSGDPGVHALRHGGRVRWTPVGDRRLFVARCERLGAVGDLEVGAVPFVENPEWRDDPLYRRAVARYRPGSGNVLWVVADKPEARDRLNGFAPAPTLVLAEGAKRTAFWALERPLAGSWVEQLNRRLAHRLGCAKKHAGLWFSFAPPGAVVHRERSSTVVKVESWSGELYGARRVAGGLEDPPKNGWAERQRAAA